MTDAGGKQDAAAISRPDEPAKLEEALRKGQAQLSAILESSLDPFYALDADWRFTVFNKAAEHFFNVKREVVLGKDLWEVFPRSEGEFSPRLRRIIANNEPETFEARSVIRPDRFLRVRAAPVQGGGLAVTFADITDLRLQAEEFHALADNIPTLCWMAYADGHIYWYNQRWYEYTGTRLEDQQGWGWESVHHPDHLPQVLEKWRRCLATGEPFEMVFPLRRHDGEFHPFLTRVVPIRGEDGRIARWFGVNTDVTEQEKQKQHLNLLLNELNHRVKNTLATIQSMAVQSFKSAPSAADGLAAFEGRLLALSAAHNVLTEKNWEGADLATLAGQSLRPFSGDEPDRLSLGGPSVWLDPTLAVALALVLHELATNALKFGALSTPRGQVALHWSIDTTRPEARLYLTWDERSGPRIVAVPERRGFGTRLMERIVRAQLGGAIDFSYPASGFSCAISTPLPQPPRA